MRGTARIATYIGRVLVVVGFFLILAAWDNAAELDYLQGQFPFLLSASVPGLALIIVGIGLEYVQAMRTFTARRAKQMADLNVAVARLVGFVRDNGGMVHAPDDEALTAPIPVVVGAGAAGATAGAVAVPVAGGTAGSDEAPQDGDMVVAGRSSFHKSECHLVSGRDDMVSITRLEAQSRNLSACRVCKP